MPRSRFRSVRYDLEASLEVARMVEAAGTAIGGDLLAPALGYRSENNGAYLARVASARCFGFVEGPSSRLAVTERGRRALLGGPGAGAAARREAFLDVPLFAAVADAVRFRGDRLPDDLVTWLVERFDEAPARATVTAARLRSSAVSAGLFGSEDRTDGQVSGLDTVVTSVDNSAFPGSQIGLTSHQRGAGPNERGGTMAEVDTGPDEPGGLWLDEEPEHPTRRSGWRVLTAGVAAVVVLAVVAVPLSLSLTGSSPTASRHGHPPPARTDGAAEHQVLTALSATTDAGNFDFTYKISSTAATSAPPSTTTTTVCHEFRVPTPPKGTVLPAGSASTAIAVRPTTGAVISTPSASRGSMSVASPVVEGPDAFTGGTLPEGWHWQTQRVCTGPDEMAQPNPVVTGGGVIDTNPTAMVASAAVGQGLDVSVRLNDTNLYEGAAGDTGLAPEQSDGGPTGQTLSGFTSLVEGTLGQREGPVAMLGMASPTGYLDLIQPEITAATQSGTDTVDGVPVTDYTVTNDISQLGSQPGLSSEESTVIAAALHQLSTAGFTSSTDVVAVDAAGFIRRVVATDTFSDGGTVVLETTFSNFGCAGTVLMPGQTGSGAPPAGCTSPDDPSAPTTTTTGPSGSTSTTSTTVPETPKSTTTTTGPPSSTTSTTDGSTTSTGVPTSTTATPPDTAATSSAP